MAQFEPAFDRLMQHEGGYVFDPHDPGGETFCGISRVFWPHWGGWPIVDAIKATGFNPRLSRLKFKVMEFYRANYWRKLGLIADQRLAYAVLDTVVQFGVRGTQAIQGMVGVDRDGIIGMQTVTAINNSVGLLEQIVAWRKQLRREVIAANPSQARFAKGWEARDNSL